MSPMKEFFQTLFLNKVKRLGNLQGKGKLVTSGIGKKQSNTLQLLKTQTRKNALLTMFSQENKTTEDGTIKEEEKDIDSNKLGNTVKKTKHVFGIQKSEDSLESSEDLEGSSFEHSRNKSKTIQNNKQK